MLRYKTITSLAAILTLINAAFFLLLPGISLSLLGGNPDRTGILMMRMAGACAVGVGVMTWMGRRSKLTEVQRLIIFSNILVFGLLVFIDLLGVIPHLFNAIGWLILIADLAIFTGFALSLFIFRGIKH